MAPLLRLWREGHIRRMRTNSCVAKDCHAKLVNSKLVHGPTAAYECGRIPPHSGAGQAQVRACGGRFRPLLSVPRQ